MQSDPEIISRFGGNNGARTILGVTAGTTTTAGTGLLKLARYANGRNGFARYIYIVDLVGFHVRRIGGDDNRGALDAVTYINLLGDAIENRRQGFINGVKTDQPLQIRMNVNVLLAVAGEGEQ